LLWGGIIGIAITFPLVFGWLHFEHIPGDLHTYQAYVFGFPTFTFYVESLIAFVFFHGLVWSAILIMAGTMLAMCILPYGEFALDDGIRFITGKYADFIEH